MRSPSSSVSFVCSLAVALALVAGCGSRSHGAAADATGTPAPATPAASETSAAAGPTAPATSDPSDAIAVRVERSGADVAAIVEARRAASVRGTLRVERLENGRWTSVPVHALSLRADCDRPAPSACLTLREGGALHPPAWNGTRERGQCGCEGACRRAEPGDYRFVVESCDGGRAVASAPFRYAP